MNRLMKIWRKLFPPQDNGIVFLGGTCNGSLWREPVIRALRVPAFNPVVEKWDAAAQQMEEQMRAECKWCVYVLTPASRSLYSVAELIDDSHRHPHKVVFAWLVQDTVGDEKFAFDEHERKALSKIGKMVRANGGTYCTSLGKLVQHIHATA